MAALSPLNAARIASTVYAVETAKKQRAELGTENPFGLGDMFEFRQESIARGKSGPTTPFRPNRLAESGFGYVARGKDDIFAGDVLIAIRGTNFGRGRDVWTDANIGIQKGPRGFPVHGGFNDTFNSLLPQLRNELHGLGSTTNVHIVGHSLGGGIANLTADWCLKEKIGKVHLYTFGCPRVGTQEFASALTESLAPQNIYRVHHTSDVVSMLPLFPFVHAPLPGLACTVARGGLLGAPISLSTHLMRTYIADVRNAEWETLRNAGTAALLDSQAQMELNQQLLLHSGGMHSTTILRAINSGISGMLQGAGDAICLSVAGGMTVLDRLSLALNRLSQQGMESEVAGILTLALRFLGAPIVKLGKLTLSVIRAILFKFFGVVYGMARLAVEDVYRDGG